jgi:uncharacterized repeat protein (TIGR01451 family)
MKRLWAVLVAVCFAVAGLVVPTDRAGAVVAVPPLQISKSFSPATVLLNGTTTMTLTITNPASVEQTGVAVMDILPSGLTLADELNFSSTCGGEGGVISDVGILGIELLDGTVAGSSSCTVQIDLQATSTGVLTNTTGNVSSTEGGVGNTASASITVFEPTGGFVSFGVPTISVGLSTSLQFTVVNPNPLAFTGVAFGGGLDQGLVVANPSGLVNGCGGTATATPGSSEGVSLTGGSIAPNSTCSVTVNVTATTEGLKFVGFLPSSTEGGTAVSPAIASLMVLPEGAVPPLHIMKSFPTPTMPFEGTTRMTLTIANPATVGQTGVAVRDAFPSGLVGASPPNVTNTCGGTATLDIETSSILQLSSGTIAASSSCAVGIDVRSTSRGELTNTTDNVSSTEGGMGNTATASITVPDPPLFRKRFRPIEIALGESTALQFTIRNDNATPLTGLSFTDALPDDMLVTDPNGLVNDCNGTVTAGPGSSVVSLANGTVSASTSCNIEVQVTATRAGPFENEAQVSSNEGGTSSPATGFLTVLAPPTIQTSFDPHAIPLGGTTTVDFTFRNPNPDTALTGIAFTDQLPPGLVVMNPGSNTFFCGTIVTTANTISFSGEPLAGGADCTFGVGLRGTTLGPKVNTVGPVTSTNGGTGNTATDTVVVGSPPTITKAFGTSSIKVGSSTSVTFTLSNPNPVSLTGAAFTDLLPAGLVVASPNGLSNGCGGSTAAAAGSGSIALSGGTIPASSSCAVTANVRGTSAGIKDNTTSTLTTTQGSSGTTAAASLTVVGPPTLTKSFAPSTVPVGATTRLTFTLTNPNPTTALSRITFSDPFPGGLGVAANPAVTNGCGGVPSVGPFALAVGYANATLPPGGSCSWSVNVTATSAGVKNNTTTIVSSSAGVGAPASASMTVTP